MTGSGGVSRALSPPTLRESMRRVCAIAPVLAIAVALASCQTVGGVFQPGPASQTGRNAPVPGAPPPATEQPSGLNPRSAPSGHGAIKVAILLPLTSASPETRAVANGIEKAAEMAVFDAGNPNIVLTPLDDSGTPEGAAAAAERAIAGGAEIILGPLFAQSVAAVAPVARARDVPVIAFSSDRSVGGNGVYLLSFQPEDEVRRIISYAAQQGHTSFAALVPQNAYGDKVAAAFRDMVVSEGGVVATMQSFVPQPEAVTPPVQAAAASHADAILIAQGGVVLRAIAPTLVLSGVSNRTVKFLGTGLWDDPSIMREPMLAGGWFAASAPDAQAAFSAKYQSIYGAAPPRIASLGYDALSLVALLGASTSYRRFSTAAITDPNGYSGVDGIFRFHADGSIERGLAVIEVQPTGFTVVSPAPATFQAAGF